MPVHLVVTKFLPWVWSCAGAGVAMISGDDSVLLSQPLGGHWQKKKKKRKMCRISSGKDSGKRKCFQDGEQEMLVQPGCWVNESGPRHPTSEAVISQEQEMRLGSIRSLGEVHARPGE